MTSTERPTAGRVAAAVCLLVLVYLALTAVLAWSAAGLAAPEEVLSGTPGEGLDSGVALLAAVAAALTWAPLTWLAAQTLRTVLSAAPWAPTSAGAASAAVRSPYLARRCAALLLGLVVTGAPLATGLPASADTRPAAVATALTDLADRPAPRPGTAAAPTAGHGADTAPAPGWTPDRPAAPRVRARSAETATRLVASPARHASSAEHQIVVRRGDTLWDIAARHLGGQASAAEVVQEWPLWHDANRAVIGADADLLVPGQRLVPPRP